MRLGLLMLFAASGMLLAQKMYVGAWPGRVIILDEKTGAVEGDIKLTTGAARSLFMSGDKKRLVAMTHKDSAFETIDLATRKVVSTFALTQGNKKIRVDAGPASDREGKMMYAVTRDITKTVDRFEIGKRKFSVIDMAQQKIVKQVDVPAADAENFGRQMRLSPDGKFLYAFGQSVIVYDTTAEFKEVERIDLAKPPFPNTDTLFVGGDLDPWGDPAVMMSTFQSTDNIVHRGNFGIARFDLNKRTFDFTPIGPVPNQLSGLQVTPDRKTGYAVSVDGQHGDRFTQILMFDMEKKRLIKKAEFSGRTRFTFGISSDGKKLLLYGAGNTIEYYDAQTLKLEKDIDIAADMTTPLVIVTP
jgi:DNA-binding beta-propeller fold protein YncE